MKKIISHLLATVLAMCLIFSFTACRDVSSGKTGLQIWVASPLLNNYKNILATNPNDRQGLLTKAIVEKFEEENPDIKLSLINKGWDNELNMNLVSALNTNRAGDIVIGELYIQSFIQKGYFDVIDFGELNNDIVEQAKITASYDGNLYAVPGWTGTFGLNINKKVLRDAGILDADNNVLPAFEAYKPLAPQTWEDLLHLCRYIRDNRGNTNRGGMILSVSKGGSAWRALTFMRTAGGDFVDTDRNLNFDTDENEKAFKMIRDFCNTAPDGALGGTTERQAWEYFYGNNAAYVVESGDILADSSRVSDDMFVAPLPTFEGNAKSNVMVGTAFFSIVKTSKNKDAAQKFLKFLLSDFAQKSFMNYDMRIPVTKSYLSSDEIKTSESYNKLQPFINSLLNDNFNGSLYGFTKNAGLVWDEWFAFYNDVLLKTDNEIRPAMTATATEMARHLA